MSQNQWVDDIKTAISGLSEGLHPLSPVIYDRVHETRSTRLGLRRLQGQWRSTIRENLQRHSSDTRSYGGGADLFISGGPRSGLWGLRPPTPAPAAPVIETPENQIDRLLRKIIELEAANAVLQNENDSFRAIVAQLRPLFD